MTPAFCVHECATRDFALAGLENGSECFCGNALVNGGLLSLTTANKPMACVCDASLTCGGLAGLQLYRDTAVLDSLLVSLVSPSTSAAAATSTSSAAGAATTSAAVSLGNGFSSTGACIAEIDGRLLKGASFTSDVMTYELCTSYCANNGFTVAGVEYGRECYCDNAISVSNPSTQCNSPCSGDSSKICGGGQALFIFTASASDVTSGTLANGWKNKQLCLAESSSGRLFSGASYSDASGMTLDTCSSFCESKGYTQAGLENGQECYCSSNVDLTTATTSSACSMACKGDQTQNCGGGNALWVLTK